MKRFYLLISAVFGGLTALVLAALSELASGLFGLPGIAFSIFDWMARHLPGAIITFFIENMIKAISALKLGPTAAVAKSVEQAMAVLIFTGIGVVFGLVLAALGRRSPARITEFGVIGGLVLLVPMFFILFSSGFQGIGTLVSAVWLGLLFAGWGWVLATLIQYLFWPAQSGAPDASRRRFLYLVGAGSFTVLVSAVGISVSAQNRSVPVTGGAGSAPGTDALANTSGPAKSPPAEALAGRFQPVPGTRPELTSNAGFYRVDINTIAPGIDAASWRLDVKGLVDHPMQLTLDQIRARPSVSQAVTQECISNDVGGDLISSTVWTGIRLKDLLAEAGMQPAAKAVYIKAADGFYESVPMSDVQDERTLLVYAMEGQPLPSEHGFPLRIYIPNRFGMKQPKWITSLEVIDHDETGYWEERGWSNEAVPPTTSVIDAVDTQAYDSATGMLPVGGIAYAGARGISKVEVQVDNGPWQPAELRTPPLSPLTWVQWRYLWKSQIGQHTFRVRAYDGTGKLQSDVQSPPEPEGATGIFSTTAFAPEGEK